MFFPLGLSNFRWAAWFPFDKGQSNVYFFEPIFVYVSIADKTVSDIILAMKIYQSETESAQVYVCIGFIGLSLLLLLKIEILQIEKLWVIFVS